jgi:glyoxylase-like metal-dependent hydrolase (beta-lactamase superfamily II)
MHEIARDVAVVPMLIANAYLAGNASSWVLVDSGTPGSRRPIRQAAAKRFGAGARPKAIVLTHGHFDHAGAAAALADEWGVPVYVHPLEIPFLTGRSHYPPLDSSPPGFFSALSRFFPSTTTTLGDRLKKLDLARAPAELEAWATHWECHHTPGHTMGHVSFFRREDGVLLAGDAVTTMNLDSLVDTVLKRRQICRPPVPATMDWVRARQSVEMLAALRPRVVAAGHGLPVEDAANELQRLANHFPIPVRGRYVRDPVRADETGVTYVPPKAR